MAHITTLNRLPVIVTGPGNYLARDGRKIRVHEVTPEINDPTVTAYAAKGTLYTPKDGGRVRSTYMIWHISGRSSIWGERYADIVAKA